MQMNFCRSDDGLNVASLISPLRQRDFSTKAFNLRRALHFLGDGLGHHPKRVSAELGRGAVEGGGHRHDILRESSIP